MALCLEDLNDALDELRLSITIEGFNEDAMAEIAEDFQVNPALLKRKFIEKHGCEPSEYKAMSRQDMRLRAIDYAMSQVESIRKRFIGNSSVEPGQVFKHTFTDGTEVEGVSICLSNRGIEYVNVNTMRHMYIYGSNQAHTFQIAKKIGLV